MGTVQVLGYSETLDQKSGFTDARGYRPQFIIYLDDRKGDELN